MYDKAVKDLPETKQDSGYDQACGVGVDVPPRTGVLSCTCERHTSLHSLVLPPFQK